MIWRRSGEACEENERDAHGQRDALGELLEEAQPFAAHDDEEDKADHAREQKAGASREGALLARGRLRGRGMLLRHFVARAGYGLPDRGHVDLSGIKLDGGAFGGEIDFHLVNAVEPGDRVADVLDAIGAVHPLNWDIDSLQFWHGDNYTIAYKKEGGGRERRGKTNRACSPRGSGQTRFRCPAERRGRQRVRW